MIEEGIFDSDSDYWGTSFEDINKILSCFQIKNSKRKKFKKWCKIPSKLAIVSTNYDKSWTWHWVIFVRDNNGHFIYDPGKKRKKNRDLRGKMSGWFVDILSS